jgi:hypothetical protein
MNRDEGDEDPCPGVTLQTWDRQIIQHLDYVISIHGNLVTIRQRKSGYMGVHALVYTRIV